MITRLKKLQSFNELLIIKKKKNQNLCFCKAKPGKELILPEPSRDFLNSKPGAKISAEFKRIKKRFNRPSEKNMQFDKQLPVSICINMIRYHSLDYSKRELLVMA